MTTAHILPAQLDPVSKLMEAQHERDSMGITQPKIRPSFIPENNNRRWLLTQAPVDMDELEQIRQQARNVWSSKDRTLTTYRHHFAQKELDEPTPLRPTSANRKNKPHPPVMFLTCHMHNVPGFTNADDDVSKPIYKVDGSVSPSEQRLRDKQREKFQNRPDSKLIRQYSPTNNLERVLGPSLEMRYSQLGQWEDEDDRDFVKANTGLTDWQGSAQPSLHRHMKYQGPAEAQNLKNYGPFTASNVRYGCWRPKSNMKYAPAQSAPTPRHPHAKLSRDRHPNNLVYQPTRTRGEYLIHPMWPPTLPHHHVP